MLESKDIRFKNAYIWKWSGGKLNQIVDFPFLQTFRLKILIYMTDMGYTDTLMEFLHIITFMHFCMYVCMYICIYANTYRPWHIRGGKRVNFVELETQRLIL